MHRPFVEGGKRGFALSFKGTIFTDSIGERRMGRDFIDVKGSDGNSFLLVKSFIRLFAGGSVKK